MNTKYNLKDLKKKPIKNLLNGTDTNQSNEKSNLAQAEPQEERTGKKKLGRRPKKEEDRLTKKVTVNFTISELNSLQKLSAENFGVPIPKLIRELLKKYDVI